MAATQFHLVTDWSFEAPIEGLAGADGAGRVAHLVARCRQSRAARRRRRQWRRCCAPHHLAHRAAYTLAFAMRVTKVEPMTLIEGRAEGELAGLGRWTLRPDGARTHVCYDWIVEVTKPWMRRGAPLRSLPGTTAR